MQNKASDSICFLYICPEKLGNVLVFRYLIAFNKKMDLDRIRNNKNHTQKRVKMPKLTVNNLVKFQTIQMEEMYYFRHYILLCM